MDLAKKDRTIQRTSFTMCIKCTREVYEYERFSSRTGSERPRSERPFKRPALKIPKFSGSVGKWLQFWPHFWKIHEDKTISKEDKLEYLKQTMEKGSKAESIVQGYPTSAKNYEKAFNSLKNRFGRDDLLVEYYTRKLLALVLQSATNKEKKASVSEVYDKVSAHIRALETLGIATDNGATMLYLLVESALPEEILRTWQCSSVNNTAPAEGDKTTNRLTLLLTFLEAEVKNKERINMVIHGFSVTTHSDKKSKDAKVKSEPQEEQPTANALLSTEDRRKRCLFCNGNHENAASDNVLELSNEVRKSILSV